MIDVMHYFSYIYGRMKPRIHSLSHLLGSLTIALAILPSLSWAGAYYNYQPYEYNDKGLQRPLWRYVWREAGKISQVACVLEQNDAHTCHWDAPITMTEEQFLAHAYEVGSLHRYSGAGGLLLEKYIEDRDALKAAGEKVRITEPYSIYLPIETIDGKKTFSSKNGDILSAWLRSLNNGIYDARRIRTKFDRMYRLIDGREETKSDPQYAEVFPNVKGNNNINVRTFYAFVDQVFVQYAVEKFKRTGERTGFLHTMETDQRLRAKTSGGDWVLVAEFSNELTRSSYDRYSDFSFEMNPTHFQYTCANVFGSEWRAATFEEIEQEREALMRTSLYSAIAAHPYVWIETVRTQNKYGTPTKTGHYYFKGNEAKRTTWSALKESFGNKTVYRAENIWVDGVSGLHRLCYRPGR